VFELARLRDTLIGLYGPDADGGQREPAEGHSALFACTVNGAGELISGTAALSSCAWAVARALRAPENPSLAGFDRDAHQFAGDLALLAGADGEAATLLLAGGQLAADADADTDTDTAAPDTDVAATGTGATAPDPVRPAGATSSRSPQARAPGDAATPGDREPRPLGDLEPRPPGDREPRPPGDLRQHPPGDREPRPLGGGDLRRFAAVLSERLGVADALRPGGLRVRSYLVDADRAAEQTAPSFLNSCYAGDLARVAAAVADGEAGAGLTAYLTGSAGINAGRRVDVRARPEAVWHGCLPGRIPAGRWPADLDRPLALGQQFAVNEIFACLGDAPGLIAVNGPPGTGPTTLLRDLIAAVVVTRAERLADLASPADAFVPEARYRRPPGDARPAVTPLNPSLTGAEIVVASSANGAVENVTAKIPGPDGIGARWRESAARVDYFTATARLVHGDGAWALIVARLGNPADRRAFTERFWWGAPGRPDGGLVDLLGRLAGGTVDWDAARAEFLAARGKVAALADERAEAALALSRLPGLRREAAAAYDAITVVEDRLRTLASQRVAAERSLRADWHRYGATLQALDAHARVKPGLLALLATRFRAQREWRARRDSLEEARRGHASVVDSAQWAAAQIQAEFAVAVRERAAASATLRRLSAECAASHAAAVRGREQWGRHFPSGPESFAEPSDACAGTWRELAAPWADEEFAAARTELFLAALALHKALVSAQADRVRRNLSALVDFLSGKDQPDDQALLAAWQTLFLLVPAVSTTFASLPAMFGGLGPESIGWLLVDEAGLAPPQQAAGAIWRAKRTVVVGDAMQFGPVMAPPGGGQQALLRLFGVSAD
jgi:hypothetical protein